MATISVRYTTNDETKIGSYEVKIFAGLDENPEEVMKKALARLQVSLQSISEEERYQRIPAIKGCCELW